VAQRDTRVRTLFTEDAVHYVSPGDISFAGRDKIEANITAVHDEQIQKAGLAFTVGRAERNRGTMKLDWKIATPAGATVLSGADVFVLDETGRLGLRLSARRRSLRAGMLADPKHFYRSYTTSPWSSTAS
jgi:hypothetical protein